MNRLAKNGLDQFEDTTCLTAQSGTASGKQSSGQYGHYTPPATMHRLPITICHQ